MSLSSVKAILAALFVTVSVTLFSYSSQASGLSCASIYAPTSLYTTSNEALRTLLTSNYSVVTDLKAARENPALTATGYPKSGLSKKIYDMQTSAEDYFRAGGIRYQKQPKILRLKFQDGTFLTLGYDIYKIEGKASGDEFSQIIYAAKNHEITQDDPPKFVFDLFYEIKEADSGAHYVPGSNTVQIGPRVIEGLVTGLSTDIHHEILHAFEERKIALGYSTLARITLLGGEKKKGDPYAEEFTLDELDTNIGDLERLTNPTRIRYIEENLAKQTGLEKLLEIRKARARVIKMKIQFIDLLLGRAVSRIEDLKQLMKDDMVTFDQMTSEAELSQGEYSRMTVNLDGLDNSGRNRKKTLRELLSWSEKHIDQLIKRFQKIKKTL